VQFNQLCGNSLNSISDAHHVIMCIPTDPRKGHRHPDSADSNIKAQFEELGSSAIVAPLPISASSLRKRPRNGRRWFALQRSSRS